MWPYMLHHFSHVRLCATPWTAAHQAPLSKGFSRQEYWSGFPFPSPRDQQNWVVYCSLTVPHFFTYRITSSLRLWKKLLGLKFLIILKGTSSISINLSVSTSYIPLNTRAIFFSQPQPWCHSSSHQKYWTIIIFNKHQISSQYSNTHDCLVYFQMFSLNQDSNKNHTLHLTVFLKFLKIFPCPPFPLWNLLIKQTRLFVQ